MFCVYKTDPDWIKVLRKLSPEIQINFWRRNKNNSKLPLGSWFYFNERGTRTIVGRAIFIGQEIQTIDKAWQLYGIGNGVNSLDEFRQRAADVLGVESPDAKIGCLLLSDAQFLAPGNEYVASHDEYPPGPFPLRLFEDNLLPTLHSHFKNIQKAPNFEIRETTSIFKEGAESYSYRRGYERNPEARKHCLDYHGYKCKACGLLLEEKYGSAARELIHVHHLFPISNIGEEREIDAINELAPLCPNCHAVAHRREPPFSIEEIKIFLGKKTI
jgi:5-methylcytosine-specific restriction endonuclease McrA